ncbi:MAG: hypothetical protein SPF46_02835, partial [Blautia sp.]|nr:hypothetical protein [Blautia sp.]
MPAGRTIGRTVLFFSGFGCKIQVSDPPLGLCTIFSLPGPNFREIKAKIRGFDCQKYLYKIFVSPGPGNLEKLGLKSFLPFSRENL